MKRVITILFTVLICFLLQTTIFQALALADVVPNLLLIVTVAFGYMRGEKEGIFVGLFCGLLIDCVFGDIIGICSLIYMVVGYLNGLCNKLYYSEHITVTVTLVALSDLIYNFFYYIIEFLFRNRLNFFFYLRRIIIPELVYTVLISILLYKLLHTINNLLEQSEQKEA
ncbi:rod shape-determining protein MreD [Velocimicrobium porci]|uniref:Rod shape-determining protein MreD n=1 Tax=Velocimicrobium porci TaxID=2606634 RepID=A0A6L5Y003_9FIRM|nr:rod shape-determining protein MreD [Velocimicrobium porci]MSS64375.1 rod shape-determining protein MreD [Velocimicrobium porci]